jgi:hypothetical protein
MQALLINNKEIIIEGRKYVACPELEEYQYYTVIAKINFPGRPLLYEIEESERWLLAMRFVPPGDDSENEVEEVWELTTEEEYNKHCKA